MTYERTETGQIQRALLIEGTPHSLILRAEDVRKERTGVHAKVTIGIDSMRVDGDTFNIGRREDRTRLANAALKSPLIEDLAPRLKNILDHELLIFLEGLWEFEVGRNAPERRGGAVERKAPPWLLSPYILRGSGTILFGPPGRGKSWTAYAMAVMLDAGYGFFYGVPADGAPVMIVNLERSAESVDARLGDINVAMGLVRDRPIFRLDRRGRKFQDVADSVARVVEREGVALVVLDSLSRAGYGDLNANEDTNRGMDALNGLGTAWLAIGHTPRTDETHLFGSQMQDAAADVMVQLLSEERIDQWGKVVLGVGLKGMKANDVRRPPLTILAYEFDEIGLTAIRKARQGEFLTIENTSANMDVRGQVTSYLQSEGQASATAIARDLNIPRTTIASVLKGPEFKGERNGRSVVYSVTTDDVTSSSPLVTSPSLRRDDESPSNRSSHRQVREGGQKTSPNLHVTNDVTKPDESSHHLLSAGSGEDGVNWETMMGFEDEQERLDSLVGM